MPSKVLQERDLDVTCRETAIPSQQPPCGRDPFGRTSTEQNVEWRREGSRSRKHDRTDPQHRTPRCKRPNRFERGRGSIGFGSCAHGGGARSRGLDRCAFDSRHRRDLSSSSAAGETRAVDQHPARPMRRAGNTRGRLVHGCIAPHVGFGALVRRDFAVHEQRRLAARHPRPGRRLQPPLCRDRDFASPRRPIALRRALARVADRARRHDPCWFGRVEVGEGARAQVRGHRGRSLLRSHRAVVQRPRRCRSASIVRTESVAPRRHRDRNQGASR